MPKLADTSVVISGLGVVSPIGLGVENFWSALLSGSSRFSTLKRDGRGEQRFIGAELADFSAPSLLTEHRIRGALFSAQVAVEALSQAWSSADLNAVDSTEVGLVVGGSNLSQREQALLFAQYQDRPAFVRPSHAVSFLDTDICGICTQVFGIHAQALTVGAASASGQLALIQAYNAVKCGQVQTCIAMGALQDIGELQLQAFQSLGAMAPKDGFATANEASRPFDQRRQGFVYGENCAAIVIETLASAQRRAIKPLAQIAGTGVVIDGNRATNPSEQGELGVIKQALSEAGWSAKHIDYVNPHGTGSIIGDQTELSALKKAGLEHALINTTKSITGHGLSGAGTVELLATTLQLHHQRLHPSLNLQQPIGEFCWVKEKALDADVQRALSLSMGFGGINTAVCLERIA